MHTVIEKILDLKNNEICQIRNATEPKTEAKCRQTKENCSFEVPLGSCLKNLKRKNIHINSEKIYFYNYPWFHFLLQLQRAEN